MLSVIGLKKHEIQWKTVDYQKNIFSVLRFVQSLLSAFVSFSQRRRLFS
jgi:hypothetical protein